MSRLTRYTAILAALAVFALLAYGQSTFATITGSVTDATGAVVPDVEVTAVHKTLGLTYTTRSNDAGIYTLPELREGEYNVTARKSGFRDFVTENVNLIARAVRRIDVRLTLGTLTEAVEVTADAGAIETERATISSVRSQRELNNMPISANSLYYMFMTLPMTQPRGSSPSFAGSRNDQYQMSVDGASINSGTGGVISNLAGQTETFKEMKVEMVNNTAEHSGLGHVILLTKSGENNVHGSAFWNYQSPGFRARDYFATDRAAGIDHEYGIALGGPVYIPRVYDGRNRTFWYFTADSDGASQLREELTPNVPLERWRNGDFAADGLQIRNPLTGEVYKDGRIPASAINPVSKKIQDRFWPLPNVGDTGTFRSRNHLTIYRGPDSQEKHGTAKIDQRLTDSDYMFASFQLHQVQVRDWDGSLPAFGPKDQIRYSKNLAYGYTHTFSPRLLNQFRFSWAFNSFPRRNPLSGLETVNYLGIQGLHPNLPDAKGNFKVGFSGLSITAISATDTLDPGNVNNNTNFYNDLSFFTGRHNIKTGFQFAIVSFDNMEVGSSTFGSVSFSNNFTKVPGVSKSGHAYADFLLGIPTSSNRGLPSPLEQRKRNVYDWYIQDDWKVSPRLSLSLGLRYEYHAPWRVANNMMSMFDVTTGRVVVTDKGMSAVSPQYPASYAQVVSASSAGLPASLVYGDKNNLAPRVSAAFRPFNDTRTVIRAGYSMFYDMTPYKPSTNGMPFVLDEPSYTNPAVPDVIFPVIFPSAGSGKQPALSLPSAFNPRLVMPYTQQWSFSIDHERWGTGFTASYVGTAGRQMFWSRDYNAPLPDEREYNQKPRPFMQYGTINYADNGSNHTYQALNLSVNRKLRAGPQFSAGYTWGRDLGDDVNPENPFNRRRDRGPDSIQANQRLNAMVLYELPFGRGQKLLSNASSLVSKVVSGWEVSAITYQQTGQHLTPGISVKDPTGIRYTTSGRTTITIRPDVFHDPNLPKDQRDENGWFDLSAFGAPPIGRFGTAGRGIINGPGVNVFHAAVHKSIRFTEGPNSPLFKIGLVATNAFNHTNFANPNVTVSSVGSAATISSTGGPNSSNPGDRAGSRQMFLRMKVEW